jgi:tripartite-type tricarboxylate transporter receptor subunit TctC
VAVWWTKGYIKSGKLRALGVSTVDRSPVFPELPSIGEFLPGYESSVWFGIAARCQTPADIVELLNKEINAGLVEPAFSARINEVGGTPLKGSSADFEKLFVGDSAKWSKVMKAAPFSIATNLYCQLVIPRQRNFMNSRKAWKL